MTHADDPIVNHDPELSAPAELFVHEMAVDSDCYICHKLLGSLAAFQAATQDEITCAAFYTPPAHATCILGVVNNCPERSGHSPNDWALYITKGWTLEWDETDDGDTVVFFAADPPVYVDWYSSSQDKSATLLLREPTTE